MTCQIPSLFANSSTRLRFWTACFFVLHYGWLRNSVLLRMCTLDCRQCQLTLKTSQGIKFWVREGAYVQTMHASYVLEHFSSIVGMRYHRWYAEGRLVISDFIKEYNFFFHNTVLHMLIVFIKLFTLFKWKTRIIYKIKLDEHNVHVINTLRTGGVI